MKVAIPKRLPTMSPPDPAAREYYRNLKKYAEAYIKFMRIALGNIVPFLKAEASRDTPDTLRTDSIRMDANIEKELRTAFEWVTRQLNKEFPDSILKAWGRSMVGHVNRHAKKNTEKFAKAIEVEAEPLMTDGKLSPYFQNVVEENVGLIRSIPESKLASFKNKMVNAITKDMPSDQIREIIQENFDVSRSKAKFLARDQVGKLNGSLNQYRQQQLGGKRYRWRGTLNERERPDHRKLEGKIFSWDSPPITNRATGARNHPGGDFQCHCHAEMVMEDVVD